MFNLAQTAVETLYRSGVSRVVATRYGGLGSIFAFHSVVPDRSAYLCRGIRTSTELLDAWLVSLRASGTDVVTLDEAVDRLKDHGRKRFVVVTFDDGYIDNLTTVLRIFKKYNFPFTIYITSEIATRGLFIWWIGLERLFQKSDRVEIAPMQKHWLASTTNAKLRAYKEVSDWVLGDVRTRAPLLRDAFVRHGISMDAVVDEVGLSEQHIRSLARHRLVTIGAHTLTHPQLAMLSETEARTEMLASKSALESMTGAPVMHFAYPFGDPDACGKREARLAQEVGFKTAVTTRSGCLFPQHLDNLHLLPRLEPNAQNGQIESLSLMHVQQHGLVRFIKSRGGNPIATS